MALKNIFLVAAALAALPAAAAIREPGGVGSANGVQVYQCRVGVTDPASYIWSFVAPDVTLYDGTRSTARLASPNLVESTDDRSSVSGIVRSTQPGGANNLPWTVMRTRSMGDSGMFAGVTSIQRVNTNGGIAPATGCNADTVGSEARVAYSADYYFYKRRGTS